MTFDEAWKDYCSRTGNPATENRGLAEEFWNAGREAMWQILRKAQEAENAVETV